MATKKATKKKSTKARKKTNPKVAKPEVNLDNMAGQMAMSGPMASERPPTNAEILREIEVIDVRNLGIKERFGVLSMLDSEGYISAQIDSLLTDENLRVGLTAPALGLQHANKIVRLLTWDEAMDSHRISRPGVFFNVQIGFSSPEANYPLTMEIGNVQYVRIN